MNSDAYKACANKQYMKPPSFYIKKIKKKKKALK